MFGKHNKALDCVFTSTRTQQSSEKQCDPSPPADIFTSECYGYANKTSKLTDCDTAIYRWCSLQTATGFRRKQCTPLATFIASRAQLFISFNALLLQFCYSFSYIFLTTLLFLAFYRWLAQSAFVYRFCCARLQRSGKSYYSSLFADFQASYVPLTNTNASLLRYTNTYTPIRAFIYYAISLRWNWVAHFIYAHTHIHTHTRALK